MITHVVFFRWNNSIPEEQLDNIESALGTLPGLVPSIKTYKFGSDVGDNDMDFAVVATFDSLEHWRDYNNHPEHEAIRATYIRPWIAERQMIQFESE